METFKQIWLLQRPIKLVKMAKFLVEQFTNFDYFFGQHIQMFGWRISNICLKSYYTVFAIFQVMKIE